MAGGADGADALGGPDIPTYIEIRLSGTLLPCVLYWDDVYVYGQQLLTFGILQSFVLYLDFGFSSEWYNYTTQV